jgi:hypothetical protein
MSGKHVVVALEPAWPIGSFAWRDNKQMWLVAATGCTASGHVVPMERAACSDRVPGDVVLIGPLGATPDFVTAPSYVGAWEPTLFNVYGALEHFVAQAAG